MAVLEPTETAPGPCLFTEAAAEEEEEEEEVGAVPLEVLLPLPPRLDDFFLSSEDFFFLSDDDDDFFFLSSDDDDEDFFLSLSLLLLFFFFSSESPLLLLLRLLFLELSSFLSSLSLPLLEDLPKRGIFNSIIILFTLLQALIYLLLLLHMQWMPQLFNRLSPTPSLVAVVQ